MSRAADVVETSERGSMARLLCNPEAEIGESPVAHSDGRISWADPVKRHLLRYNEGRVETVSLRYPLWSLAAPQSGGLFGAGENGFYRVDSTTGDMTAGPSAPIETGCRLNDMAMDSSGGLWAGVMHRGLLATRGGIVHAPTLDAIPRFVASGLGVPNGMAFSPDGRTLFVIDTLSRTLVGYPVAASALGEPAIISDFLGLPGKPDGMTLGPDNSFWVAMWGGGCVVQLAPDGAFLHQLEVPAPHVSSLCFAAPDQLLVTTSRMRLSPSALARYPESGGLFLLDLEQLSS